MCWGHILGSFAGQKRKFIREGSFAVNNLAVFFAYFFENKK
jgi:hypothetical protein